MLELCDGNAIFPPMERCFKIGVNSLISVHFQALEGLGGSQMARSQGFSLSSAELTNALFDGEDKDLTPGGDGRNLEDFAGADGSTFQDDAWISPPDSIYSSSPSSVLTSTEVSLSENADRVEQPSALGSEEPMNSPRFSATESVSSRNSEPPPAPAPVEPSESMQALCLSNQDEPTHLDQAYSSEKEVFDEAVPVRGENETLNPMKRRDEGLSGSPSFSDPGSRVIRGKESFFFASSS